MAAPMAAPSRSPHFSSSTVTTTIRPRTYDVFLNFRGLDTRHIFVDHLYFALVRLGIHTYRDDITLHKGDHIHPSLMKAIDESQIAVTIFSKNYGDSSPCLRELAHIMKCREERGLIVIPIFYDVVPMDVKELRGEFGEAFANQIHSKNSSKVESWRKALVAAGKISGWEPKTMNERHEAENTYTIANKISERLKQSVQDSNTNEGLIGMKTRKEDFISLLDLGSGGVRMVGIWGIGGGGKTTIASSVYSEISNQFDGCCFIENIWEASEKYGLQKLQEKVVFDVLKILVAARSGEERGWMIKSRLRLTRVLIVLDDVAHHDHLEALAGSRGWFGKGSRIIITTRDEHLLNAHQVEATYNVSLFNEEEAIQLFDRHVLWKNRSKEDQKILSKLSLNAVSYAGGVPLVLKVLGRFLCDKDTNEWLSALTRLEDIPEDDFMKKLKISYDGLKPVEQELFLDIVSSFMGETKEEAMMILDACGFDSLVGVKVLIQKALISITDDKFDIHDVIQKMGHYIIRGEHTDNPENCSRVCRYEDVENICASGSIMENNKIRVLHAPNHDAPSNFLKVVADMKKLRLLYVRQNVTEVAKEPLSLSNLLRWISWEGYPASSLPTNFQPTKLVGIILKAGLQKELWRGHKQLPSLKVLDLRNSKNLIRTPDFDGLPNLERLVLTGCSDLQEIDPSVGCLKRLVDLYLDGCYKLEWFPPIVTMHKLKVLKFSRCSQLAEFPEIRQVIDSLVNLFLDETGIEIIPLSISQYFTSLKTLDLRSCAKLTTIEGLKLLKQRCSLLVGSHVRRN